MTSGLSVADAMALQSNGMRGDGFLGGYGAGDFILGLLFGGAFGGFNGFGFGNRGYAGDLGVQTVLTRQDINDAIGNQTITMKLDGISNGICDSTYATNQNISNGFANAIASQRDSAYLLNSTIKDLGCETNTNILKLGNQVDRNTCEIITNANYNTRELINSGTANTQRIIDFLTNEKICAIQSENLTLKGQLSQLNQTSTILSSVQAMIDKIKPTTTTTA